MTLISGENGLYRFALNENDRLSLYPGTDYTLAHFNQSEPYAIPTQGLQEIRVESQTQLHFQPSPHNEYLAELMDSLITEKGFCVDIGAYDGLNYSHTFPFFQKGWKGLAVECDAGRFSRLAHIYRMFEDVNLSRQKLTPHNVCSLLRSADVPQNFELLSLDIDSYDYFVLEALLAEYRPSVICAEINEVIPPPVKFAVKYDPAFQLDLNTRFYGQSLSMLAALCERYNYAILRMYYMDVFLIDRQYIDGETQSLDQLYKEGLLDLPRPPYYQSYPFDVESVWVAEPEAAAEMVRQGFEAVKTAPFICEI